MGKEDLTVLKADLTAQMNYINSVVGKIENRSTGMQSDDAVRLESVAYQIHNLYSAVEDLLRLVAAHFENNIADPSRWHTELLYRMTQDIAGVRPALLSDETYILLNGLRSFRHFFRHAYSVPIEFTQLEINLEKAFRLYPLLADDVVDFLRQLGIDYEN